MSLILLLGGLVAVFSSWLGWQLLRQNGRLLLRIEEFERRLDELEFGGEVTQLVADPDEISRTSRFGNHSLANSKIKRDGLKAGTPAPDFRLPRLDGRGDLSLEELRGRRVLLVFSDPHCGPCNAVTQELEKFYREQAGRISPCAPHRDGRFQNGAQRTDAPYPITIVMISKGEPKETRAKVKEHSLTFLIVLQQQWEISRRYAMFATPVAYLIDERGIIARGVAVGSDQIRALLSGAANDAIQDGETSFVLNSAGNT